MEKFKRFKLCSGLLTISCLLIFSNTVGFSQETKSSSLQKNELISKGKDKSSHSLFGSLGYGSNMIYMGSNVSRDKPFYSGSLTYGFKNEFFATVATSHLSAFDPLMAFSTLSLGYNHTFNSWLDISLGLSGYQVNSELTETLFSSFLYSSLSLGFDWKVLYTTVSASGLFSESSGAYFSLKNSRYFKTPEFSGGKAWFYFDPYINLLFGTLTETVTSEGTTIGVTLPSKTKKPSGGSGSTSVTTSTFFSLMEADFGLPVGLNIGKLSVEAEPGYILPAYSGSDSESPGGFTLLLNIFYKIF